VQQSLEAVQVGQVNQQVVMEPRGARPEVAVAVPTEHREVNQVALVVLVK
jgi:hypothetical protein